MSQKLVIVESPTKARTIGRFLGEKEGEILATMGHIRDLPEKRFGVKITENGEIHFEPQYQIIPKKRDLVKKLKEKIKEAKEVFLATDPDREGEAIAYHVMVVGGRAAANREKFKRVVFHEITPEAIEEAFSAPRQVDMNLVDAQQARRVLDRIVGYKLSPLLWRKVRRGLSAGRVQSVAVRLIVEREREIEKFKKERYFRIWAKFVTESKKEFWAELTKVADEPVEIKEKKKLFAGEYQLVKTIWKTEKEAEKVIFSLPLSPQVNLVEEKERKRFPFPPFTTSKLQQEASRRFGWSAKLTMRVAQSLYEKGMITYHRTDSVNLSEQFLSRVRGLIKKEFGKKYLPSRPFAYKTKSKLAQEAHEAIRPTDPRRKKISGDSRQQRLYQLIWKRAVASQMRPAKLAVVKVEVKDGPFLFVARGTRVIFPGFSKVYPVVFAEKELPLLKKGEKVNYSYLGVTAHQTQPPPRYTEASLIATLEKEGIGRPSTYAPIISVIQQRLYVEKEKGQFFPTNLGTAVNDFLVAEFPDILSLPFTAQMEDSLDKIAGGKAAWMKVVGEFWRPFIKRVKKVSQKTEKVKVAVEKIGEKCPQCGKGELVIKEGRFGKFIACSRFPDCKYTRPLTKEAGFNCPECGAPVVIRQTKKGKKFYGCSRWPDCKWASWKKP